jgi:glycosyltransferase involved in cell wall biosynthesis
VTNLPISLVVPIRDEEDSIRELIESVNRQTRRPSEIILVDGGSTDNTVKVVETLALTNPQIKLIRTAGATPGKGRNIGIEATMNEWIALTDAGITLDENWIDLLFKEALEFDADIVYGNISPNISNLFEKCAAISYVPPAKHDEIRSEFIASSLLKKDVWRVVGGFPDLRAAEDLIFMENLRVAGFRASFAPGAMVHWQLRPNVESTFQKFVLYSKHNAWIGRQWDWHYGIAKHYLLLGPFFLLAALNSWWWLFGILLWLFARTTKRILSHRFEFGAKALFNPGVFLGVAGLILVIDAATFIGWIQALFSDQPQNVKKRPQLKGGVQ